MRPASDPICESPCGTPNNPHSALILELSREIHPASFLHILDETINQSVRHIDEELLRLGVTSLSGIRTEGVARLKRHVILPWTMLVLRLHLVTPTESADPASHTALLHRHFGILEG
jgi:hypothetical protein